MRYIKKYWLPISFVVAIFVVSGLISFGVFLRPVDKSDASLKEITIERGMGMTEIASRLKDLDLIRSSTAFEFFVVVTLRAHLLKSGDHLFSKSMSASEIINKLVIGGRDEITVVIPEGWNVRDIDALLSREGIIHTGELIDLAKKQKLEGYLFPDTYRFYRGSDAQTVAEKFLENFAMKTELLLGKSEGARVSLILASLVEKEVPSLEDRKVVAGILEKRLEAGWPLQVDATICYLKPGKCYPLTPLDFKIDSPYNTYLYKGLPVAPIANPGLDAIFAVLHPVESNYWYYLSDPKTGKTFFARTLEEQNKNKSMVLR